MEWIVENQEVRKMHCLYYKLNVGSRAVAEKLREGPGKKASAELSP